MSDDYKDLINYVNNRQLTQNYISSLKESFQDNKNDTIIDIIDKINNYFQKSGGLYSQNVGYFSNLEDNDWLDNHDLNNLLSMEFTIKKLQILLKQILIKERLNEESLSVDLYQLSVISTLEELKEV